MLSNMGSSAILRRWIFRSRQMTRSRRYLCDYSSTESVMSLDSYESAAANRGVMPPPLRKGGDVVYRFPSLAEDCILNLDRGKSEAEIVGYSHGWVALFNRRNNDLFLSDRFSESRIKLPPIDTLPDPLLNLDLEGIGSVSKVILSSSPGEDECCAMMIFGPAKRLAFCLPGRSSEWTPIGDLFIGDGHSFVMFARAHDDLVYCSRRKVFFTITPCYLDLKHFLMKDERVIDSFCSQIFEWDIKDSPTIVTQSEESYFGIREEDVKGNTRIWLEENKKFIKEQCIQIPHLVYAEHSDQLFVVLRFVTLMNPHDAASPLPYTIDDAFCPVRGLRDVFPAKTFGFAVLQMDKEIGDYWIDCRLVDDLSGMTMFVGVNHSFAVPSAQFPELKSNSIYFSAAKRIRMDGANDNGIFDYDTKTISPSPSHPLVF